MGTRQSVSRRGWYLATAWAALILLVPAGCRPHAREALPTGVDYIRVTEPTPLSIHVVAFDLEREDLALVATVGEGVNGSETVDSMVARFPRGLGRPIAAINGDYFEFKTEPRYRGTLQGMSLVDGELVSGTAAYTFWVDAERGPHIGRVRSQFSITWPNGVVTPFGLNCSTSDYRSEVRASDVVLYTPAFGPSTCTGGARELVLGPVENGTWLPLRANAVYEARVRTVRTAGDTRLQPGEMVVSIARKADGAVPEAQVGDVVTIGTALTPSMVGVRTAISGDPLLLADGQLAPGLGDDQRHPRTAVGFAGNRCFLVVVDGRQPSLSVGASRRELGEIMLRLGCTDALGLDGGGSSTFWYGGKVVNSPSDGQSRPVGNALVLARTP